MKKQLTLLSLAGLLALSPLQANKNNISQQEPTQQETSIDAVVKNSYKNRIENTYAVGNNVILEIGRKKKADIYLHKKGTTTIKKISENEKGFDGNSALANNKVFYESHKNKNSQIIMYDIDTKETTVLIEKSASQPSVTQDAQKIYFIQTIGKKRNAHKEIAMYDMNSKKTTILTNTVKDEIDLKINPSGEFLAVVVEQSKKTKNIELYRINENTSNLTSSDEFKPKKSQAIPYDQGIVIEKEGKYDVSNMIFLGDSALVYKIDFFERGFIKGITNFKEHFNSWSTIKSERYASEFYLGNFSINEEGDLAYLKENGFSNEQLYIQNIFDKQRKEYKNLNHFLMNDILNISLYFRNKNEIVIFDESLKPRDYTISNPLK